MSTLPQIEANRRNAQKSTGPSSVTGKAASSMNALKTGIYAKSLVLPSESVEDLDQLIEDYYQHHRPASPEARGFVDDLIRCEWTLRRLDAAEAQAWQYQNHDAYDGPQKYPLGKSVTAHSATFSKLQYRLDCTRRARLSALHSLKQLQAEPIPLPPVEPDQPPLRPLPLPPSPQTAFPQIGFVPPAPVPTPPEPLPAPGFGLSGTRPRLGRLIPLNQHP